VRMPGEFTDLAPGQSLAVDGVCLTVVALEGDTALFDLAAETLRRTTLGRLRPGASVNLERPLAAGARLGGHFVQGHVDGVGTIMKVTPEGDGVWMEVALPPGLARYVAEKGSLALDGVSLTVAAVEDDRCAVALIPHTLAVTTLGRKGPGDPLNVEVDILAKYLARLWAGERQAPDRRQARGERDAEGAGDVAGLRHAAGASAGCEEQP
ncbi:MAG: riboflavin synthase, partial [Armatimonadota bacterium]|nr:riboflavin synthase [Armatimonadota bacterium]